jgi:DNA-binding GntR family transcriptional regulator
MRNGDQADVRRPAGRRPAPVVVKRAMREAAAKDAPKEAGAVEAGEATDDVVDRICATLTTAIAEGALKPGVKIMEDVLGEHFGVSRTVVRGALGSLHREHLLERRRNRGTFVAEPSIEEAQHLFEARRGLERLILDHVITRATPEGLDRLAALTQDEQRIHDGGDETAKSKLAGQFHIELARLGGNAVLTELLGKVVGRLSLVMALYEDEHRDDCGAEHHRQIIAAISRRDLAAARGLMDEHLADIERRVRLTRSQGDRHSFLSVIETFSRP